MESIDCLWQAQPDCGIANGSLDSVLRGPGALGKCCLFHMPAARRYNSIAVVNMMQRHFVKYVLMGLIASLAACVSPSESFDARARLAGLSASVIRGAEFDHAVYWNRAGLQVKAKSVKGKVLHVYFDGDGTPWKAGHPTIDPTARNPLILRLMALDPQPAVFLGRPCFNGMSETESCNYTLWNDARYSEPVVASLASALGRVKAEAGADHVVLFGASGGGALAVLVADRVDYVDGIVTIAANLDKEAWLAYHDYPGMTESLNPATDGRRNAAKHRNVFERHFSGGRDTIVPANTVTRGLRRRDDLIIIPNYDHNCCWADIWPQILADVGEMANRVPSASSSNR